MATEQDRLYSLLSDISASLVFLTRIPLAISGIDPDRPLSESAWAFSVVGALVGGIGAVIYAITFGVGLSPLPAAVLAVAGMFAATGALHEDGLADTADGLAGGPDRAAKLAIMQDSRIGTYGVAALTLAIVLRIGCVAALVDPLAAGAALVAAGALSRATMVTVMHSLEPASTDGLAAAAAGRPTVQTAAISCAVAAVCALIVVPFGATVAAVLAAAALGTGVAFLAHTQIGGTTDDILGAVQQAAEIACLVVLAAILGSPV